ncbi:Mth938-like domain-containing protein [Tahibacter amnicola]|uniref:Mth938-like domain-containing protein n=1 Tax=Tahibacter amnicola TaxID=2976241 RepID=A0ABY6BJZ9_9GAMM|nr:Mth938-like domain-containing protein [Tahibacter amnicola]UXI69718.1 Mth938-like domain-containing protein [Tahibacter amnicola]
MQLSLNRPGEYLFVRAVATDAVTVVDRPLTRSFILAPERAIEDWEVSAGSVLEPRHVEPILALNPAVAILGTGGRIVFPPAAVLAEFLTRGIGVEVMDNAAAARTYNVLVSEGRRVVVAFILP